MSRRDDIIAALATIPSLPTAVIEATKLLRDPEVSIAKVTETIKFDPSLTSNILRTANSAYFGATRRIPTLKQAIIRLGTSNVFRLVVASSVAPIAGQAIKGYDLSPGELWAHSIAVGICSETLGKMLKIDYPGYIFTAGLLHDLGKIVLGNFSIINTGSISQIAIKNNVSFDEAEMSVLGIDHAEVGALLLEKWNIPAEISEVVRWHHYPDSYKGDQTAVGLVHVANNIVLNIGIGVGVKGLKRRVSQRITDNLKLSDSITQQVIVKTVAGLKEFQKSMQAA